MEEVYLPLMKDPNRSVKDKQLLTFRRIQQANNLKNKAAGLKDACVKFRVTLEEIRNKINDKAGTLEENYKKQKTKAEEEIKNLNVKIRSVETEIAAFAVMAGVGVFLGTFSLVMLLNPAALGIFAAILSYAFAATMIGLLIACLTTLSDLKNEKFAQQKIVDEMTAKLNGLPELRNAINSINNDLVFIEQFIIGLENFWIHTFDFLNQINNYLANEVSDPDFTARLDVAQKSWKKIKILCNLYLEPM